MNRNISTTISLVAASGLLLLGTGCDTVERCSLTHRLWEDPALRKRSGPAPDPNLALFEPANRAEFLVQYDEISEKDSKIRRRSYYLAPDQVPLIGSKPKWVKPPAPDRIKPLCLLAATIDVTNLPPEQITYAVLAPKRQGFTLHRPAEREAFFELPDYVETSHTPARIFLTSLSVAGDAMMVGALTAGVGAFVGGLMLAGGLPHSSEAPSTWVPNPPKY